MITTFISEAFPIMNAFLEKLEKVLIELNPEGFEDIKPEYTGFCLSYFNFEKDKMITEVIGRIQTKERKIVCLKSAQEKLISLIEKIFINEDYIPSGDSSFFLKHLTGLFATAVWGRDHKINEAISALWLMAKSLIEQNSKYKYQYRNEDFLYDLSIAAKLAQKEFASDNEWISKIARQMVIDSGGKY